MYQWSKELAVPVFSVDYSLAPEDPYPQAVMEVSTCVSCVIFINNQCLQIHYIIINHH